MSPGIFGRFARRGGSRLRLEQSLGAFPAGDGDISPLYVLFSVSNPGEAAIAVERAYLRSGRDTELELTGELGGDGGGLPRELPPGGTATLWLRAREMANMLQRTGHTGTPRLGLRLIDSAGGEHGTTFRLRVDEYLRLKDE